MMKLNRNEYNFPHHPDVIHMSTSITNMQYYENEITNEYVVNKLAKILNSWNIISESESKETPCYDVQQNCYTSENILLTAGGIGGIELLFNEYVGSKKTLVTTVPTYSAIARHVQNNRAELIPINTSLDKRCHMFIFDSYVDVVIYICNPNNPTGLQWYISDIVDYASTHTSNIIIIDEVYVDFVDDEHDKYQNYKKLVNLTNVIIIRSFSKSYGLAGIRFGYILAHSETINHLKKRYEPLHVTNLAKTFACKIMDNWDFYQTKTRQCIATRNQFVKQLKDRGFITRNTPTNFVLLWIGDKYVQFIDTLRKNNILVRNTKDYNLCGFIRISIAENMDYVIGVIDNNRHLIDTKPPLITFYTPYVKVELLLSLLSDTIDVFNENNIKYWLSDGTLLSTIRHKNKFMKWDDDIDIGIIDNIKYLESTFIDRGLVLVKNRFNTYWQIRYNCDVFEPLIDFYKSENYHRAHIDIFNYSSITYNGKKMWKCCDERFVNIDQICKGKECNLIYHDEHLFPLIKSRFENIDVNIPNQSEKILEISLGKNYKTTIILSDNGKLREYDIREYAEDACSL